MATALAAKSGPLDEGLYKQSIEVCLTRFRPRGLEQQQCVFHRAPCRAGTADWQILGKDNTIALIHYIGFYSYVAVLLNGFDASIPE